MSEYVMKNRRFYERAYGRYIVVVDGDIYERFFSYEDALKYKEICLASGISAFIIDDDDVENSLFE